MIPFEALCQHIAALEGLFCRILPCPIDFLLDIG